MKIGFSFGRGLGSIMRGEVAFEDVLCIIARTRMETEQHVREVVDGYMYQPGYLMDLDQAACEEMGVRLFNSGKILEPRANGIRPMSVPRDYIWMDLFPTAPSGANSDAVNSAWDHYRMLITLTEQLPEAGFVPEHSEKIKPPTEEEQLEMQRAAQMLMNSI
jgi:hypothetical protein